MKTIKTGVEKFFTCPDGYIFKDENGNVINATKILLEKKKKEYPKTYDDFISLVKRMREAQVKRFEFYVDNGWWADRAIELEKEVDEYLKKMEEDRK